MTQLKAEGRLAWKSSSSSESGGTWSPFLGNLVVSTGGAALAAGLAALDGKSNAVFHALGAGRFQWDAALSSPSKSDTGLVQEFYRAAPNNISFVEEVEGLNELVSPDLATELHSAQFGAYGSLLVGRLVEIVAGTCSGDVREVIDISPTESPVETIVLDSALSAVPDTTTRWRVGVVSSTPTQAVDIETTFLAADGNSDGQIREQALFLGQATAEKDSGTMLSIVRHPAISKSNTDLTQVWRIRIEVV